VHDSILANSSVFEAATAMIPESGSRSELKRWLCEELWVVNCYYEHRLILSDEFGFTHAVTPMAVVQEKPVHACFYCSVEVQRIVQEQNIELSQQYLNAVLDGTRMWQSSRDQALAHARTLGMAM
jgi:hypothetical protein